jgi:hypothetical protein
LILVVDVHHKPRGLTSLPSYHLYQVHKVQHKPTKKISWGTLQNLDQRQALVLPVAHQIVSGVHWTLSGAQAEHHTNWPLSGAQTEHHTDRPRPSTTRTVRSKPK